MSLLYVKNNNINTIIVGHDPHELSRHGAPLSATLEHTTW